MSPPNEPTNGRESTGESPRESTTAQGGAASVTGRLGTISGYEILRCLSVGGQGEVYQALQLATKRKVAIKTLRAEQRESPASRARFEREIELIAQLDHPNIISIFHSDVTSAGVQFFVMDYVRGEPLNQYVRSKNLSLKETLRLFERICDAVQYAHARNVIHRDLKPSNILVYEGSDVRRADDADSDRIVGEPKILDFGLAKWMAAPVEKVVSMSEHVMGTLPYMSPEQVRGHPDQIDARSDVYALGVILYELLTGHFPYPVAGPLEAVVKHITETPPTPPSRAWRPDSGVRSSAASTPAASTCPIDEDVQTIVLKALDKERSRRYQSAGELAEDVARHLEGKPILARGSSALYVASRRVRWFARRHRITAYAGVVLAAMLVTLCVGDLIVYEWTPLNRWFEGAMIRSHALTRAAPADLGSVRIIGLPPEQEVQQLVTEAGLEESRRDFPGRARWLHGLLMQRLALSGLRVFVWDGCPVGRTSFDDDFLRGVRALRAVGVDVVVGTTKWHLEGEPDLEPPIANETQWGCMAAGFSDLAPWRLELVAQRGTGVPRPSLDLCALLAFECPGATAQLAIDRFSEVLRIQFVRQNPAVRGAAIRIGAEQRRRLSWSRALREADPRVGLDVGDIMGVFVFAVPSDSVLEAAKVKYADALRAQPEKLQEWFAGKVVVCGPADSEGDRYPLPGGRLVAGCLGHAAGINALLAQAPIRIPPPAAATAVIGGAAVLGVAGHRLTSKGWRTRAIVLVALVFMIGASAVVAYSIGGYLVNPILAVLALLTAWVLAGAAERALRVA